MKKVNDLSPKNGKKVKIACQQGGPHVGLLDDVLRIMAQLDWKDVEIVWTPDLTGDNGPAEKFRKDKSIDACCVITPDMIGLTGGLEEVGLGAEGTVKGAHVLASTDTLAPFDRRRVCLSFRLVRGQLFGRGEVRRRLPESRRGGRPHAGRF